MLVDADGNELPDLGSLLADGDLDIEELQAALDQRMDAFNSLPFEQRRAHTDAVFAVREPNRSSSLYHLRPSCGG